MKRALFCLAALMLAGCTKEYVHVGPNWKALDALSAPQETFGLDVRGSSSYSIGNEIKFSIKSKVAGRLWVAVVNSGDEVSLIYPQGAGERQIPADVWVEIPMEDDQGFYAAEPAGPTLVVFLVTTGVVDVPGIFAGGGPLSDRLKRLHGSGAWALYKLRTEVVPK
jgi:hypothetical protein